ncbi:MAG: type II toxin-antitoxin system RelE/ParE family toxin [Acidobacteria bacterium]|nr:type II toxin-antitoxin system RelE/ParE family toxin [Acidobacteriota bacterium]MDA1233438.1 type II toxin-antitoxin system RelE/ParE family toxin [Acidobacteriota bacterium]
MRRIRIAPAAAEDLAALHEYLVEGGNEERATEMVRQILSRVKQLGKFPRLGTSRSAAGPGWRVFPEAQYLIYYRQRDVGIELLRVLHGSRNQEVALRIDR